MIHNQAEQGAPILGYNMQGHGIHSGQKGIKAWRVLVFGELHIPLRAEKLRLYYIVWSSITGIICVGIGARNKCERTEALSHAIDDRIKEWSIRMGGQELFKAWHFYGGNNGEKMQIFFNCLVENRVQHKLVRWLWNRISGKCPVS